MESTDKRMFQTQNQYQLNQDKQEFQTIVSDSKSASIENPLAAFDSWHNNISPGESINTGLKESYSSNPSPSIKKIVPVSTVKIIEDH